MTTPGKDTDPEEEEEEEEDVEQPAGAKSADNSPAAVEESQPQPDEEKEVDFKKLYEESEKKVGKDTDLEEKDLEQGTGAEDSTPAASDDSSAAVEKSKGTDEEKQVVHNLLSKVDTMATPGEDTDQEEEEDLEKATGTDSTPAAADESLAEESKGTDEEKQVDFKRLYEQSEEKVQDLEATVEKLKVVNEFHRVRDPRALDEGDQKVLDAFQETQKYAGDEQRRYALMFLDATLELFNEVTDILLCVSQKRLYNTTGDVFHKNIFIACLCVIVLEIALRLTFGVFLDINERDNGSFWPKVRQYKEGVRWYQKVAAGAVMLLEPNLAEAFFYADITKTTNKLIAVEGTTYVVRDFYNLYEEIKLDFSTRQFLMMIFLIEDIPEFFIEVLIAAKKNNNKVSTIVWVSLAATVVHFIRHSWSMFASWKGKKTITEKFGKVLQPSDLFKVGYSVSQVLDETSQYTYEKVIEAAVLAGKAAVKNDREFSRISTDIVHDFINIHIKNDEEWDGDLNEVWKNLDPKNFELEKPLSETKTHFFVLKFEHTNAGFVSGGLRIEESPPDDYITRNKITPEIVADYAITDYATTYVQSPFGQRKVLRLVFFPKYRNSKPFNYTLQVKAHDGRLLLRNVHLEKWKPNFNVLGSNIQFKDDK